MAELAVGEAGVDTWSLNVTVRAAGGTCWGTRGMAEVLGNPGGVIWRWFAGGGTLKPGGVVARAFAADVLTERCWLGGCCSPL